MNKVSKVFFKIQLLKVATCAIGLSSTCLAFAYPVLLPAKEIQWLVGSKRDDIIAIAKNKAGTWERIGLQSEEIEEDVAIVFRNPTESMPVRKKLRKPKTKDPFEGYFDIYHRLSLNDNQMTECDETCSNEAKKAASTICTGNAFRSYSKVVRIDTDYTKKTAFLVDCQSKQPDLPPASVSVDMKKFHMEGNGFKFRYKNERSVMLDQFLISEEDHPVLTGTEMHVFLKPKFMFNLEFGNEDVTAEISSLNHGPLSLGVEIATALNILIFQVNKQICCDINIFEDAIYFPVMLDLPYGGDSFLPGSGLFYGFNVSEGTKFEFFPIEESAKNADEPKRPTRGATAMTLEKENKVITIGFGSLQAVDGKALAPAEKTLEEMRQMGFKKIKSQSGLFYDATRLPDGFNHFNVWIYIGTLGEKQKLVEYAKYGVTFKASRIW